ncbi:Vms1/Ankzf1 family peptidyl-tRNA hydrolase [Aquipuribacter nitratireducens]|uniref:Vms1/Ankzf1 family peptidyl-tRNA hydrolase n=1 Tax=Aquipuribacter nitratireducens TaxID=650104 RepID=A0ABW0GRR1_9MICO
MHLGWLSETVTSGGAVAAVHVDVTRTDPQGEHTTQLHWQAVRDQLGEQGAPDPVVDAVEQRVTTPTGEGGELGRHLVLDADHPDEPLLDLLVEHRPTGDAASFGPVPSLVPLLRALDSAVPYLLVEADRAGADVTVVDFLGRHVRSHGVEGGHELLHKVRSGGWSHRRMQSRVEDSWERNADAVVAHVRRLVDAHHPEVVLLTGDPTACGLVRDGLAGTPVADRLQWLRAGGRADGVDRDALDTEVADALRKVRLERMGDVVARFEAARGQDSLASTGLPGVVGAVQRAAVDTLLVAVDALDETTLFTDRKNPTLVGTSESEVRDLGGQDVVEAAAVDVLVRACAAQDASLELVDGVEGALEDGVGALLRFDVRPATPTEGA